MNSMIFDLDGTLADTSRDLISAANSVLCRRGFGEPLDHPADILTAFQGGRAMLRAGLAKAGQPPDGDWVAGDGYRDFLKDYETGLSVHTHLYPGVIKALDELAADGWRLGICTNKPERLARILLEDLGIIFRFLSLIGADTLSVRKPHSRPLLRAITEAGGIRSKSMLVGDTHTDVQTARAAGVPVALVAFGPQGCAAASLRPDAFLESFEQLPDIARQLCGQVPAK